VEGNSYYLYISKLKNMKTFKIQKTKLFSTITLENKTYITIKNNKNFIVVNGISYYEI